jgi:hypothetical protein
MGTVVKMVWYSWKSKHRDEWSRIENPEIYPQDILN